MNAHTAIEAPKTILGALAAALPELEGAKKNKANPAFKSKYADLGAVIEAIQPIANHGLWFRQVSHPHEGGVCVETFYIHESGELSAGTFFVPADRNNAQGYGSANSYARRYGLQLAFGLATEDDDGNAAAKGMRGQSQEGAVSLSPKAEPNRVTGVKLDGPYKSITALEKAIRDFAGEMDACTDWDSWLALRERKDIKALLEQAENDHPDWWNGWDGMPDRFIPLGRKIEMKEYNLANQIADIARV